MPSPKSFDRNYIRRIYAKKMMLLNLLENFLTRSCRNRSAAGRKMAIRAKVTSGNCKTKRNFIFFVRSQAFEFLLLFFVLRFRQFVNEQRYVSAIDKKSHFSFDFIAFVTLECIVYMSLCKYSQLGRFELAENCDIYWTHLVSRSNNINGKR